MYLRVLSAVLFLTAIAHAADVRGTVVNSQGGEPLANVRVLISDTRSTTTAADGSFSFAGLMVGDYTLRVEAIGFWLQRNAVHIADQSDVQEYSIALVPEGARRNETLDVHADRFTGPEPAQASAFTLTGAELRDAATVLAADPLRSVQAMPGVTSSNNNDFFAQFTVRGADYSTVGVYLDGMQLRQPFHGIPYMQDGASVSLLSPDTLDSLTLIPTSFSERYSDATGAALDARTRDGAATAPVFRLSVGIAESHFAAEGRLPAGLGSWLLAARKSYMGYLLRYSTVEPTVSVSFYDVSSKLVFQVAPRHVVDAYILDGHAALSLDSTVSPNQVNKATILSLSRAWVGDGVPHPLSSSLPTVRSSATSMRLTTGTPATCATIITANGREAPLRPGVGRGRTCSRRGTVCAVFVIPATRPSTILVRNVTLRATALASAKAVTCNRAVRCLASGWS